MSTHRHSDGPGLLVLGCSHHTAGLDEREALTLPQQAFDHAFYAKACGNGVLAEALVVATCNRLEVYAVTPASADEARQRLEALLAPKVNLGTFQHRAYLKTGEQAAEHLFAVAAGLDSQILGETEIFGQMKAAYAEATGAQATGAVLNRLFQRGFQAAKWARTHTATSR